MNMKMIKTISSTLFLFVASIVLLSSCHSKEKTFSVNGEISQAEGEVLYIEHRGLGGIAILDSVKLKENGKFSFKEKAPENPEFYQLRLGNQIAVFAVDSTQTLDFNADGANFYNSLIRYDREDYLCLHHLFINDGYLYSCECPLCFTIGSNES